MVWIKRKAIASNSRVPPKAARVTHQAAEIILRAKKVSIVFFQKKPTNLRQRAGACVFSDKRKVWGTTRARVSLHLNHRNFSTWICCLLLNLLWDPMALKTLFYGRCSLKPILSGKRLRQKLFRKNRSDVTGKIPRQLSIKTLWFGPWILFPSLKLGGTSEKYFRFGQLGGSHCFHVPAKGSLFCIGWKLHEIRLYLKHLQHIKVEYMLSLSLCMHCLCSILSWFPISEENCGFFRELLEAKSLQCFRRPEFEWVGVDTISRVKLAPPSTSQAEQNVLNSFDLMEHN